MVAATDIETMENTDINKKNDCSDDYTQDTTSTLGGYLYPMNPLWCNCGIIAGLTETPSSEGTLVCYLGNLTMADVLCFYGKQVEVTGYWFDCMECWTFMVDNIEIPLVCGDVNSDGIINVSDPVFIINYVFIPGSPAPNPLCRADANGDSVVGISDAIYLINYVFISGSPAPYPECCDEPSGSLVDMFGCKTFDRDTTPPDQDCIIWEYDEEGLLELTHVNAGFNCCPELTTDITIEGTNIIIEEIELSGDCDCLCLFDLNYTFIDLPSTVYTVHVIEPYVPPAEELLEFTMDLTNSPMGSYCVERTFYPWGFV